MAAALHNGLCSPAPDTVNKQARISTGTTVARGLSSGFHCIANADNPEPVECTGRDGPRGSTSDGVRKLSDGSHKQERCS